MAGWSPKSPWPPRRQGDHPWRQADADAAAVRLLMLLCMAEAALWVFVKVGLIVLAVEGQYE